MPTLTVRLVAVAFLLPLLVMSASAIPWADGPLPLVATPQYATKKDDLWTKGATHMALLHNAILRGFNSVYLQAPHVRPADYADFVGYAELHGTCKEPAKTAI